MVICVVQFWSEIILVISNQTRAARSFDFEITRIISDQIALHSVQLPLLTNGQISMDSPTANSQWCDKCKIIMITWHMHKLYRIQVFLSRQAFSLPKLVVTSEFKGQASHELTCKEGEVILLISKTIPG